MNKLFTLISVIIFVYIMTSCAATQPREKQLVGTWRSNKVSPYVSKDQQILSTNTKKITDTTNVAKHGTENKSTTSFSDKRQAEQFQHFIDVQMRTTMKFNADKTGEIQFPGKTINAKWKLKKKGTILVVRDLDSGQKRSLELVFLHDTSAMAIQRTNFGDIIVRYSKQQEKK